MLPKPKTEKEWRMVTGLIFHSTVAVVSVLIILYALTFID